MPTSNIQWEIVEAFDKFGFDEGNGHNFTETVKDAIEAAGPYECIPVSYGSHNYAIGAIVETTPGGQDIAEFDGYELPEWDTLPEPIQDALVALNDGQPVKWSIAAA